METEVIGLTAALLMGLAGSTHCFGMCGGIAGALGMRIRSQRASAFAGYKHAALYQAGRITGYAALGAVVATIGHALHALLDLAQVSVAFRVISGVLLMLIAVRMLAPWNGLAPLERLGARGWKLILPWARRFTGTSHTHTFMLGLLWAFLPCGMVYSMLAFASVSGSAINGAALMTVFGIGTVPAMFGSTVIATHSTRVFGSTWAKRATGILLATFGVWMITAPFMQHIHDAHLH